MLNLVNAAENANQDFLYRGADAVDVFCDKISEIGDEIKERMQENKEIEMTDEHKKDFETATHCLICGDTFNKLTRMKKKQGNTKKFATIVIFQVSIEGVLIAFVI